MVRSGLEQLMTQMIYKTVLPDRLCQDVLKFPHVTLHTSPIHSFQSVIIHVYWISRYTLVDG